MVSNQMNIPINYLESPYVTILRKWVVRPGDFITTRGWKLTFLSLEQKDDKDHDEYDQNVSDEMAQILARGEE